MKKLTKALAVFALTFAVMIAAVTPQTGFVTTVYAATGTVALNKTKVALTVGDTVKLKLKNATGKTTWKSKDTSIAKVSSSGKVTAKKVGTVKIVCKNNGTKYTCKVTVKQGVISVSKNTVTVNGTGKLKVTLKGDGELTCTVADSSIVSCEWGEWSGNKIPLYLTGEKTGNTNITITNSINSQKYVVKVKVTGVDDEAVDGAQALKNYISKNGSTNSSGNKFISETRTISGTEYSSGIVYDTDSDTLQFIMSTTISGASDTVSMTYYSSDTAMDIECIILMSGAYGGLTASVKPSACTKDNSIKFTIDTNYSSLSTQLNTLGNSLLDLGLATWELILNDETGMSLTDLGFTNYQV